MGATRASIQGFSSRSTGIGATVCGISIVDGRRTAFGKLSGALCSVTPTDLGISASRAALEASRVPASEVSQAIVANIGHGSGDSLFLARHIALYSGAALETPALLVQRLCGSGIEVLAKAAEQIAAGQGNVVLGCGTESMSRFPLVSFGIRQGFSLGKPEVIDFLWEALNDTSAVPMGHTADNLARQYKLTRLEVDEFALQSQSRYRAAYEQGVFKEEMFAFPKSGVFEGQGLKPRKFRANCQQDLIADEHPRQTTMEKLATLPFAFTKEGPTTAGNASGIVDGAAASVIASDEYVTAHGLKPIGKILGYCSIGVEPQIMGIGPAPAIRSVLKALKMNVSDIDLFEINEAFGAQCLAVARELELDLGKLNVNGGAVAIGHPLAATGMRLAISCLKTLRRQKKQFGVVSACIGGGQGIAMVLEVAA
ncbi:MAG: thiolase family protein [Deltaproteobacteria bacterium]|nr:thiolase family protein [Deltaproteobacteria bacterium]